MPDLLLLPVPDVDRRRYRHDEIYVIATEDLSVLNLLDNDDPDAVCATVREQLPQYSPKILVEGGARAPSAPCEAVTDPPLWAKRLRADFAISEGRVASLAALPVTAERDRFLEGLGALLVHADAIRRLGRAFSAAARGETSGLAFDYAMAIAFNPDHGAMAVRLDSSSQGDRRVSIRFEDEPAGLARCLRMAFELPRVPIADFGDQSPSAPELMALSAAFGALAAVPQDGAEATVEISNAALRVTATARVEAQP